MSKIFALLILLFAVPASAAPTYDNESSTKDATISSLPSYNLTVGGACTNTIIVVSVATAGNVDVSGLNIGGSAATPIDNYATVSRRLSLWYRKGVSTGVNAIAVTLSGEASVANSSARSYCGVDQTTAIGTPAKATGYGTSATVNITSASGDLVVDAAMIRQADGLSLAADTGNGQVQRYNDADIAANTLILAESEKAGAVGTTTLTWTLGGADEWYLIGVSLKASVGAPSTKPNRRVVLVE